MGITVTSIKTLERHVHRIGGLKGCKMLELGNQHVMMTKEEARFARGVPAKPFFAEQGVALHVSVDINGQDGALPMDLSMRINKPEWRNLFDIVTDFGTSEHVGNTIQDLHQCRENCHTNVRVGGIMIFVNPMTGCWPGHGHHYFTCQHYALLAEKCGYRVLEISEQSSFNDSEYLEIHAVLMKIRSEPFIQLWQFEHVCHGTVLRQ